MMQKLLIRTFVLTIFSLLLDGTVGLNLLLPRYVNAAPPAEKLLLAANPKFPLKGSKFTELGDHRHMETQITISNNGRIDSSTHIWTDKLWKGFTGAVAVVITDSAGNVLYVTEPHTYGVDCRRCPGSSNRTQQWSDAVPSNVLGKVGGYAILHTTSPRDRWRSWLSTTKEAVGEVKGIYSQF